MSGAIWQGQSNSSAFRLEGFPESVLIFAEQRTIQYITQVLARRASGLRIYTPSHLRYSMRELSQNLAGYHTADRSPG